MPAPPSYQKVNPADQPVMFLALRSKTLPLSVVDEYAQQLVAQRISTVKGVAQVDVPGSQKYAVRVDVDPRQLAARAIGIDEVATADLQRQRQSADRHHLRRRPDLRRAGQRPAAAAAAYAPTIVAYRNGDPVRLDEVAHVYDGVENDKTAAWYAATSGVSTSRFRKQPGTQRRGRWSTRSRRCCRRFASSCPPRVTLDIRSDRVGPIRESVHDVKLTLLADHRARGRW